jgi:anti-sigma regulatory factor (Ser/Thr protein kinase)
MSSVEVRARFPADPASAAKARRFLDTTLRGWQCEHLVDVATLLASELVANAILHAGSSIEVVARVNARLRIEVHDDNPRLPVRKHYSRMSATGRGLLLVERLAEEWGADPTQLGKRVWFELDQARPAGPEEVQVAAFGDWDLEELTPEWAAPLEDEPGGGGTGPRLQVLVRRRR